MIELRLEEILPDILRELERGADALALRQDSGPFETPVRVEATGDRTVAECL